MEHKCIREGDITEIKGRVSTNEGHIKELKKAVDELRTGYNKMDSTMELIKKDIEYAKKGIDKIDTNLEKLTQSRLSDEFIEPLKRERTKTERRQSQFEGAIIGMIVTAVLGAIFALLTTI